MTFPFRHPDFRVSHQLHITIMLMLISAFGLSACGTSSNSTHNLSGTLLADPPNHTTSPTVASTTTAAPNITQPLDTNVSSPADTSPSTTSVTSTPETTTPPSTPTQNTPETTTPPSTTKPKTVITAPDITAKTLLTLDSPIALKAAPNDDLAWVAERGGRILRVNLAKGEVAQIVLDISEETTVRSEQGLLDIALTADWLYVSFTDLAGNSRIDAFKREGSGVGSHRETILTLQQPFSNHNGGGLTFGDDGYLYIGFGDGGSAGDPHNHGQNPRTLLGTIVRINPTPGTANPYTIPSSNPYAQNSSAGAPEVFLIGLRNPWRFSFDQTTGDLWIADVGQNRYEEINMLPTENQINSSGIDNWAGSNLGWKLREGTHPYCTDCQQETNLLEPIWVYPHGDACSVTGGFVYRGSAIEGLYGWYVFGDYCTSKIWGLDISTESTTFKDFNVEIPGGQLASFGQDKHGELYTLSLQGEIAQIRPK